MPVWALGSLRYFILAVRCVHNGVWVLGDLYQLVGSV